MPAPASDRDELSTLLHRWQESNDRDALESLLQAEIRVLRAQIRGRGLDLVGADQSVSDVAQESVLRLLEQLQVTPAPRFDTPQELSAYLWQIAWHLLVDRLRKRGQAPARLDSAGSTGYEAATTGGLGTVERRELALALKVILNLLKAEDLAILEMCYFKGMSIEDAARELGIEYGTAKMRLKRARDRLQDKLEGWADLMG